MASYTIKGADETTRARNQDSVSQVFHHFEVKGHEPLTTGTITVKARPPGAPNDRFIDLGVIDTTGDNPSINHVGVVSEWQFTCSGINSDLVYLTITSTTAGKSEAGLDPALLAKLEALPSEADLLSEGLALGQLYAKQTQVG